MSLSIRKYKVDFQNYVVNSLAYFYRFQWLKDFLFSIISTIQTINDEFYQTIFQINDYLGYTAQHLAMEELLNDKYDSELRRIFITENNIAGTIVDIYKKTETNPNPILIYKKTEINPAPIVVYKRSEYPVAIYDFTINIPVSLYYNPDILDKLIKSYIDTRSYNIITF